MKIPGVGKWGFWERAAAVLAALSNKEVIIWAARMANRERCPFFPMIKEKGEVERAPVGNELDVYRSVFEKVYIFPEEAPREVDPLVYVVTDKPAFLICRLHGTFAIGPRLERKVLTIREGYLIIPGNPAEWEKWVGSQRVDNLFNELMNELEQI